SFHLSMSYRIMQLPPTSTLFPYTTLFRSLMFFLYTFLGSLALLLGFIGLYVASDPHTFDIVALTAQNPLAGGGIFSLLVLLAIRSEEHTSELQSRENLVCRLLLEKKKNAT